MIYDIEPLVWQIRQVDFSSASVAKASAVGGLLRALQGFSGEAPMLLGRLLSAAVGRFRYAVSQEEQMQWFRALMGMEEPDSWFADVMDDDEYDALVERQERVRQQGLVDIEDLLCGAGNLWEDLPLGERLCRLQIFYWQDICQLSQGDDGKARSLVEAAARCFERCRAELFESPRFGMDSFLLYYHVLCLAKPGYRNPAHVPYYKQYFQLFDCVADLVVPDSDEAWQYQEVLWSYRLQREHHYDLSLLPHLSLADSSALAAFRTQCYRWLLDADPDDDHTVQEDADHRHFTRMGIHRLLSWLDASLSASSAAKEAEVLLTLLCALQISYPPAGLHGRAESRAYDLFPQLPPSKLRTRLMLLLALDDPALAPEADALIAKWTAEELTPEDHCLLELYRVR